MSARLRTSDVGRAEHLEMATLVTTALAIGAAAARISRIGFDARNETLGALVDRLRQHPRPGIDAKLAPRLLERLLPLLPPYRIGRCVKRSLYLLDLWSGAGLQATLRLGYRPVAGGRLEGHAWVTTDDPRITCVRPADVVEAIAF